ncbi:MAG: hypothetical protein DI533_00380 [Cereibacter sphaeroides]|uniref:Uncharacterized protein n=1 Tax=Cereibacter sphaeroides TaxID=1063 RepID=A0A2W5SB28_CERSP|nr:MAG: hypothetical protein DI533_00380 [Cereibacter sphaeroides]
MTPIEVYVGFHSPSLRNGEGQIDPRCWLGHVVAWGYTEDETWFFLDPQGAGMRIAIVHRYEDVNDLLAAHFAACAMILRQPYRFPEFRIPLHGLMTCATICGQLTGVRALLPRTLRRRLLARGAEIIHEVPKEHRRKR